jgi:DNA replication protein DnaC
MSVSRASARCARDVAPQGLGKSLIAQKIAHQGMLAGQSVLFTTAAQPPRDIGAKESARALDNRLGHHAKIGLLVVDEVGCLAFDERKADLRFQAVCRRYEKKSLVLTTNLASGAIIIGSARCPCAIDVAGG